MTAEVKAYGAVAFDAPLQRLTISRRACSANDVVISVKYAGICHSDIHTVRGEWGPQTLPLVPGHEIGGHVLEVGSNVTKFQVGDIVGVGCMVDSCRGCGPCRSGSEQYCTESAVYTYGSKHKFSHCAEYNPESTAVTQGGYSQLIVVDHNYVLSIPASLDLAKATPLMCAGITMYSPMIKFGLRPMHRFAVVGLGGLGHMGVKLAVAFGCHVTVISRGLSKRADALENLGAHAYLDSTDAAAMTAAAKSFDFILDTVSAHHDIKALMNLMSLDAKLIFLGAPPSDLAVNPGLFIGQRRTLAGSLIGGIQETQEMLDFCGRHNITCDIELISADRINEAYDRTMSADVKYRFVIDTATL